jgi:hypothetical protein
MIVENKDQFFPCTDKISVLVSVSDFVLKRNYTHSMKCMRIFWFLVDE